MPVDIIPENETARMNTLNRFEILNTLPEPDFDAIAVLASEIFDTDKAHICFVDQEKVFFKACYPATGTREVPRENSLCALSILKEGVTVYNDTHTFYELTDSPFLTDAEGIRFYAAAPIRTADGFVLGTICVTDTAPRLEVTNKQTKLLQLLADIVMEKLESRLAHLQVLKSYNKRLNRLAHDLKNPVTSISLYAQLLGSRDMSPEKVFSMAAKIEVSSKKLEKALSNIQIEG